MFINKRMANTSANGLCCWSVGSGRGEEMRMKSEIKYDKNKYVKKLTLQICPETLTFNWPSKHGIFYLIDAIEKELIKDCARKRKEEVKR